MLPPPVLPTLAYNAIADKLGIPLVQETAPPEETARRLEEPGASFVTLTKFDMLRGCIGSLQAVRPLREDIQQNARSAAFADPRFPPLRVEELPGVSVDVSELSTPVPLHKERGAAGFTEAEVLNLVQPGEHGLVLSFGAARATFLPSVWEELPDPAEFLNQLKLKAGLPSGFWDQDVRVETYLVHSSSLRVADLWAGGDRK